MSLQVPRLLAPPYLPITIYTNTEVLYHDGFHAYTPLICEGCYVLKLGRKVVDTNRYSNNAFPHLVSNGTIL